MKCVKSLMIFFASVFSREGIEDIPTARNMFGDSEEDMLGGI